MLVTALSPVIGYDKASKIAHYALDNDLTLKQAATKLGFVSEEEPKSAESNFSGIRAVNTLPGLSAPISALTFTGAT